MLEGEIVRKCLARSDKQCSFVEHRNHKVSQRWRAAACGPRVPWRARTHARTRLAHRARCAAQVVYRRYASLFVLAGVDGDENALAVLEVVHAFVEALDRYFGAVCELDIMFHLDKARCRNRAGRVARVLTHASAAQLRLPGALHPGRDGHERCAALTPQCTLASRKNTHHLRSQALLTRSAAGCVVETNRLKVLTPVQLLDKADKAER